MTMKYDLTKDDSRIHATLLEQVLDVLNLLVFTVLPHVKDGLLTQLENVQPMDNDLRNTQGQRGQRRADEQLANVADRHRIF